MYTSLAEKEGYVFPWRPRLNIYGVCDMGTPDENITYVDFADDVITRAQYGTLEISKRHNIN